MRLAVICDYLEEDWPSMNLCTQMLVEHLQAEHPDVVQAVQVRPPFRHRLQQFPWLSSRRIAWNGDRLLNRFWDYPRYLSYRVPDFDLFHIADHTYAHLAHTLPPERTGIFCHDLDAFRSLLEPKLEPRPGWYKTMSQRILSGLQKAAVVFYSTIAVRKQIEHHNLVDPVRLVHAPYGIGREFSFKAKSTDPASQQVLQQVGEAPFILHVGSCIPRKRIDVLLDIFAAIRTVNSALQLVKVGGDWTPEQQAQIQRLDLGAAILHFHSLERAAIAELYCQASTVLVTSEAEGFGLPVIEALACGAIVVASDIPVLQEVGGPAVLYCPVGNVPAWVQTLETLFTHSNRAPALSLRLTQARKYSWPAHTKTILDAYRNLAVKKE